MSPRPSGGRRDRGIPVRRRQPRRPPAAGRWQRTFAAVADTVTEGRDQGTIVFPGAFRKFFLIAADEERARRRVADLLARGEAVSFEQVLAAQRARDARDLARDIAPMKPAVDAAVVDTSTMTIEEVVEELVDRSLVERSRMIPCTEGSGAGDPVASAGVSLVNRSASTEATSCGPAPSQPARLAAGQPEAAAIARVAASPGTSRSSACSRPFSPPSGAGVRRVGATFPSRAACSSLPITSASSTCSSWVSRSVVP